MLSCGRVDTAAWPLNIRPALNPQYPTCQSYAGLLKHSPCTSLLKRGWPVKPKKASAGDLRATRDLSNTVTTHFCFALPLFSCQGGWSDTGGEAVTLQSWGNAHKDKGLPAKYGRMEGRDNPRPHWHHTAATPVLEGLAQNFLVHTVFWSQVTYSYNTETSVFGFVLFIHFSKSKFGWGNSF